MDIDKQSNKLEKHMETDICYGIPNTGSYKRIGFGKHKLYELANTLQGRIALVKLITRIKSELKENEIIFNKLPDLD